MVGVGEKQLKRNESSTKEEVEYFRLSKTKNGQGPVFPCRVKKERDENTDDE